MPRDPVKEKALPVGIFIILSTVLLIAGLIWLRGLASRPEYTFIVRYDNPDPLSKGVAVYYRGVQIGRVTEVALAPDFNSTRVEVGVTMKALRLPDNVQPYIRLEGITGQRYLELEPAEGTAPFNYITNGEVINGARSLTLDKLQEQLARIAEARTLEKILVSTQQTVAQLASTSNRLDRFLSDMTRPAHAALLQFNRTTREMGLAAGQFGGMSSEARNAIPRIANSAEQLGRNTSNVDQTVVAVSRAANRFTSTLGFLEAQLRGSDLLPTWAQTGAELSQGISSFRQTTDQFGQTLESVNKQLLQSDLIPNLTSATTEIRQGVQSLSGSPSTLPPDLVELNRLLADIHASGRTLEQALDQWIAQQPKHALSSRTEDDLQSVRRLTDLIRQSPSEIRADRLAGLDVAQLRRQMEQLRLFGQLAAEASDRLESALSVLPAGSPKTRILGGLGQLEDQGVRLSMHIQQMTPRLAQLATQLPKSSPGLFGSINSAVRQINQTAERFDCVATQLNHILSQRFLGFRLFFGRPGAGFDCTTSEAGTRGNRI